MQNNWPTKKIGISISKAKALALKDKKAMDKFYKKHWLYGTDNKELTIILKSHLYIENLIDELLSYVLPNPKKILNYKFSSKVNLLEALNIFPSTLAIEKIREINKIRNAYSHKLNKKLSKSELEILVKGIKIKRDRSTITKLKTGLMFGIGYLHALRTIFKLFPFPMFCTTYKEILKKDKSFQMANIKEIYPWEAMKTILKGMRL